MEREGLRKHLKKSSSDSTTNELEENSPSKSGSIFARFRSSELLITNAKKKTSSRRERKKLLKEKQGEKELVEAAKKNEDNTEQVKIHQSRLRKKVPVHE